MESIKKEISAAFPFESKYLDIRGSKIHYIDEGEGDPVLFLHGNPTSSYLWRNIIPHLQDKARCIAIDHIGMGNSDKPDIKYGFDSTYGYLEVFIEKLGLKDITLVLHDWGSIMGFHYANTHRENIRAIAFMESSIRAPDFDSMPAGVRIAIKMMRNRLFGSLMVKRGNLFIKKMLPDLIDRELSKDEMAYYARPYPDAKSREPLLAWPRDVPIKGRPEHVDRIVKDYHQWLKETDIPKLCFYVTPGIALQKEDVEIIEKKFKNTKLVHLGEGKHFIQEDFPHEIGGELSDWYSGISK